LPDDNTKNNKYTRAAKLLERWTDDGVFKQDGVSAIYRYNISFDLKTPQGVVKKVRPGFVALLKIHEYSDGKVRPHERTLAGPKEDRLKLISHTRANLSQIFMLYPDEKGTVDKALGLSPQDGVDVMSVDDDDGVTHTLWPITDEVAIEEAKKYLADCPVYIADGHHRYETSLAYHKHQINTHPLFANGCDYVMAYFTPMEDPGLVIFPYHRLIHNLPKRRLNGLQKRLSEYFEIEQVLLSPTEPGENRREFMSALSQRGMGKTMFGMVDGKTGQAYYLTLKPDSKLTRECAIEADVVLASMDVVILEDLILMQVLGMKHKDLLNEKYVSYETDYDRILDAVQNPPNQISFLLNPTPVEKVIEIADLMGVMPEKSTYFYPKLATGLVINSMDD
jgi:uncharacterized protein (DUF1015 family)